MGQQFSRHSNDAGSAIDPGITSGDITGFILRLRDTLSDPVYQNGINPDTVVDMMEDIKDVYFNGIKYVRLPKPMDGIAPYETIRFATSSSIQPSGLVIPPKISSKNRKTRRAINKSLTETGNDSREPSIRSANKEINMSIDEAMDLVGIDRSRSPSVDSSERISVDDNRIVTNDEGDDEPIVDFPAKNDDDMPKPTGRITRRVRR